MCELAEEIVWQFNDSQPQRAIKVTRVDIADDDALLEAYGVRIPVLKLLDSDKTLDWPFDVVQLSDYLKSHQH